MLRLNSVSAGPRCRGDRAPLQDRPAQLRGLHPGPQDAQGEHQGALPEARAGGHCKWTTVLNLYTEQRVQNTFNICLLYSF